MQARVEKQQELSKGSSYYSTNLGLIFERFPDKPNQLRFTFTLIDPHDHNRPFYFVISVDNEYYQGTSVPSFPIVSALLICTTFSGRVPARSQGRSRAREAAQ